MTSPVKERLTGALILIVALVIIVPELFSGRPEKKPATEAPDAQSADAGPPLRSYTMDLGDGGPKGKVQGQAALNPEPATAPPAAASSAPATLPPPELPPPTLPTATATKTPAARPPTANPSAANPVPVATSPTRQSHGWWVQLGSFSARANADRLGETLSKAGYDIQVAPITANGRELFRVRAGPVADRDAAVALQGQLGAAGHKGTLVAP